MGGAWRLVLLGGRVWAVREEGGERCLGREGGRKGSEGGEEKREGALTNLLLRWLFRGYLAP